MEIKTTEQVRASWRDLKSANVKWVRVDDVIKFIQIGKDKGMKNSYIVYWLNKQLSQSSRNQCSRIDEHICHKLHHNKEVKL